LANRTHTIKIRCTDAELDQLRRRVPDGGNLSAWLRGLAIGEPIQPRPGPARRRTDPRDPELVRQVARFGSNLNQVARWVNQHKGAADAVQVLAHLQALDAAINSFFLLPQSAAGKTASRSDSLADADPGANP
jgi:hypothetical protein